MMPSAWITYLCNMLIVGSLVTLAYTLRHKWQAYFNVLKPQETRSDDRRELTMIGLGAAGLTWMVIVMIGLPWYLGFLIAAIVFFVVPPAVKHKRLTTFQRQFDLALAEALQMVASSLKAGLTLKDSLKIVVDQAHPTVAREFAHCLKQYQLGVGFEEALEGIRQKVNTENCKIAIGAMIVSTKLGGRLVDALQQIVHTIKERDRVEGKLKSLTAQGRAQGAILMLAPPALGFGMYLYDPGKMALMTQSTIGQILLTLAICLEIVGIVATKKVMRFEV